MLLPSPPLPALADFVANLRSSVQADVATWGTRMDGLRARYVDQASETRASLSSVSPHDALARVSGAGGGNRWRRTGPLRGIIRPSTRIDLC